LQASIAAALNNFQYINPRLLSTSLDGAVQVEGPLAGGANISGEINVGRTEVRLSANSVGGGASVEGLTHVAESAASRQTRKRAGLIEEEKKASGASKAPVYGLDVLIDANNPIFIRGLGIDAEVGGDVKIGGTTAAIEPVGTFELVRGRADILGQRLDLTEGTVILSGNSVPAVRFIATRQRTNLEVSAIIAGPVDDLDISFESSPVLPEDQILARLLFDTDLGNLSGLQALQLANAVAVMRGGSGVGILGTIRDDLGIDNLDLSTDEEGRTNLKVGRYINETTYTDFEVRSDGNTAVTLNIDLTPSFTVRGIAESDGSSGGGIFFERDF
jgi:translocation and assembly module TamB